MFVRYTNLHNNRDTCGVFFFSLLDSTNSKMIRSITRQRLCSERPRKSMTAHVLRLLSVYTTTGSEENFLLFFTDLTEKHTVV